MRNPYYKGPRSDHFDGVRFFNPGQPSTDRTLLDGLKWKLGQRPAKWRPWPPVVPVRPAMRVAGLQVTMVGHATLLIQAGGCNYLTDPVWSERASPVSFAGPKRHAAPGIDVDQLPPIDVVLISHSHYDHMDLATLVRLQRHRPRFVMPLGNDVIVRRAIPDARIEVADWFDTVELGNGARTILTPANHWSNRSPFDYRMPLWSGHYLDTRAGSIWFAGDTGYGDGAIFNAIRDRVGAPDLSLIPIGAYDPRWFMSASHAAPEDAVRIFQDVGTKRALGIHWGTFQLTDEPRDEPAERLNNALAAAGITSERFIAARPADVFEFEANQAGRSHSDT